MASYILEYDSCESGCGDYVVTDCDLNEAVSYFMDFIMENCEEDDEIEGSIYDAETDEYIGCVIGDYNRAQFDPA